MKASATNKYSLNNKHPITKENTRNILLENISRKIESKLNNESSEEVKTECEIFRISEEIFKNETIFFSDYIKNNYIKNENKNFLIHFDSELSRPFINLYKVIKYNGVLNINSISDSYILQLIIMEFDLRYNLKLRENFESQIKILEENLSMRDQELIFLRERLKNYDENANEEQFKIFENEINKIREMLKEKTIEFLKMENRYQKNHQDFSTKFNKLKENLDQLRDENNKYIESLLNISFNLENNNLKKISETIKNLNLNTSNKEEIKENKTFSDQKTDESINKILRETSSIRIVDEENNSYPINSEETFVNDLIIDKSENTFANKVIEEFDKVFNNELKRIERHYKKYDKNIDSPLRKRNSMSQRRASNDKNYIIWKGKSPNEFFHESLRSPDKANYNKNGNKSIGDSNTNSMFFERKNSQLNQSMNVDLDGLVNQAKQRVRSSIAIRQTNKNDDNTSISNFSFNDNNSKYNFNKNEGTTRNGHLRDNHSPNKIEILNNSKMNFNLYGMNNIISLNTKRNIKESFEREIIEKKLRDALFKKKQNQ